MLAIDPARVDLAAACAEHVDRPLPSAFEGVAKLGRKLHAMTREHARQRNHCLQIMNHDLGIVPIESQSMRLETLWQ